MRYFPARKQRGIADDPAVQRHGLHCCPLGPSHFYPARPANAMNEATAAWRGGGPGYGWVQKVTKIGQTSLRLWGVVFALGAMLLGGCEDFKSALVDHTPDYVPTNAHGPAQWPVQIGRVAVLPAHDISGSLTPDFVAAYDQGWSDALIRSKRAEFVMIDRRTLTAWINRVSVSSTDALPYDLLARVERETGAEAVMFLDLTHCAPYPPLGLGVRAKLVALPDARIVWEADERFDAADAGTAHAAEHFAQRNSNGLGDPTSAVLQSPARFSTYVFQAIADLLPPRPVPIPVPAQAPAATTRH